MINIILISFIHHLIIVGNVIEINLEIEISVSEKTARSRVKSKLHNWIIDDIFIPSTKIIQYFSKNKLSFLETPIE